ncbi:sialidase family protein [Cohnella zeiphila]|uniref:Exo-alpha-sialidase n=1 Tax=Cohnella zeiphila TaxID=2761120 RepID=A0A7X0SL08_9BACL|nr:sialidase family protein [Cohnella zeiphila]MBB6730665.1 exo-alpha-sialidase [Cohnella zeiphila]
MDQTAIINLQAFLTDGRCCLDPESDRIEARLPTDCPTNHAPALAELANGDLVCAWFGGSDEGAGDIKIYMSRLAAESAQWSRPVRLSDDYSRADQNPSLFVAPNGDLWLMHTSMETRGCTLPEWQEKLRKGEAEGPFAMQHTSVVRCRISRDGGHSWDEPFTLFDRPGTFARHPITVLSDGSWLFPVWYSSLDETGQFGRDYSAVRRSTDEGRTWRETVIPGSRGRVHASIVERGKGRLSAFFRSRSADRIYVGQSADYGRSWSEPVCTTLPNNNASLRAIRLQSGAIAIVFNHCSANEDPSVTLWPYERVPVTIALSDDGGETWPYMRHLETGDDYCGEANRKFNRRYEYPTLIQSRDGMIHVAYAYGNRTHIQYACFPEDSIRGQQRNKWPWENFPMK